MHDPTISFYNRYQGGQFGSGYGGQFEWDLHTSSFSQIKPDACLQAYPIVLQNAGELQKAAELLATHQFYKKASALLILGGEECIKAFFLLLEGRQFNLRSIKGVAGIFSNHNNRHNFVSDFYSQWLVWKHLIPSTKNPYSNKFFMQLMMAASSLADAVEHNVWWKDADAIKQKGLYIDASDIAGICGEADIDLWRQTSKMVTPVIIEIGESIEYITKMKDKQLTPLITLIKEAQLPQLLEESLTARKKS